MHGNLYIYKRLMFNPKGTDEYRLVDYSDGTEPFVGEATLHDGVLVYEWKLPNNTLLIPLNVSRHDTRSIVEKGTYNVDNGTMHYEYIFGKYEPLGTHYARQCSLVLPYIIAAVLIVYIVSNRASRRRAVN